MAKTCTYESCSNPVFSKGRCQWHVERKALKKTVIKKVSDKRKVKNTIYTGLRKRFLQDFPVCQICESSPSQDIHHTYAGADRDKHMNETETWMSLCRACHTEIHQNATYAREMGWLK